MTKFNKIKFAVVSLLLAVAIGAPVASVVANQPRSAQASFETLQGDVTIGDVTIETPVVTIPEVLVTGEASKPAAKSKAARKASKSPAGRSFVHTLHQGGSPDAPTVRVINL